MTYIGHKVGAHLDRLVGWQRGERPAPVTVEWDLSNRCALGCMDCHFAHTHVRGPWVNKLRMLPVDFESTGDLADPRVVIRALSEMADAGVRGVVWSGGGEPTTHPAFAEIVAHARACRLDQGLYTFGGLVTRTLAASLRVLSWAVVSLDACDQDTYASEKGVSRSHFEMATEGIRNLARFGPPVVGVSFLLHGQNWHRADEMLRLARDLGATYTTFRPAIRTSPATPSICTDDRAWIADALPFLRSLEAEPDVEVDASRFQAYGDWTGHGYVACEGPKLNTTITPDGRVWICPQRRGVSSLGDLRHESFTDVWHRHPGRFTVDAGCRVMCRLHHVNQQLDALTPASAHEAFV